MPDFIVVQISKLINRLSDPKPEAFAAAANAIHALGKALGEFWQQADSERKADPKSFKSFSMKTPASHFRALGWMRWLA